MRDVDMKGMAELPYGEYISTLLAMNEYVTSPREPPAEDESGRWIAEAILALWPSELWWSAPIAISAMPLMRSSNSRAEDAWEVEEVLSPASLAACAKKTGAREGERETEGVRERGIARAGAREKSGNA